MNQSQAPLPTITFYVAFSIHGTNAFITATKDVRKNDFKTALAALEKNGFTQVTSRRPDANPQLSCKLHWAGLLTKGTKKPMRSPALIIRKFKELEAAGWTVNKEAFVNKHYKAYRKNGNHQAVSG